MVSGYELALKHARQELELLAVEEKESEERGVRRRERIAHLRRTVTALAALCDQPADIEAIGITEACLTVMMAARRALTTAEVEAKIAELGFDVASQNNPKASVNAVLNRLASAGKISKELSSAGANDAGVITWRGPYFGRA